MLQSTGSQRVGRDKRLSNNNKCDANSQVVVLGTQQTVTGVFIFFPKARAIKHILFILVGSFSNAHPTFIPKLHTVTYLKIQ